MLEICIASAVWSMNICSSIEFKQVLVIDRKLASDIVYLAQGRPYESDYERDTQRERERRDIWNHGGDSESEREADKYRYRDRYNSEDYRREVETDRIYRDPHRRSERDDVDDYRREAERIDHDRYESEDYRREVETDRIYRDP